MKDRLSDAFAVRTVVGSWRGHSTASSNGIMQENKTRQEDMLWPDGRLSTLIMESIL